jgi:hypothetical protein
MERDVMQLVLKVSPAARERLRRFAEDDRRNLSREFEWLMEQEATRRLSGFTVPAGEEALRPED